jgi:hypothetical protein
MAQVYDNTDLAWTGRGDLVIGHSGDLMNTNSDPLRSMYQEIRKRVASDVGDWAMYPNIGSGLSDYVGEPNNQKTAESIKTRIISSLTRNGFIQNRDIEVKYTPVDIDRIMFRIIIKVAPTAINAGSDTLRINLLYNYAENNVFVAA